MERILKKICRLAGKAIGDFGLIEDGDRILVALSGGKDSWTLLYALRELQRRAPISYELSAITVNPGTDRFDTGPLEELLVRVGFPHEVIQGNIVKTVDAKLTKGTNPCSFCARLRRGILYSFAASNGWNKIALGHHLDDFVETLLLNLFFNGSIKGMSPNLEADDGRNRVIRPLVYVKEEMTQECATYLKVPIVQTSCPYEGVKNSKREWVKSLLLSIEDEVPDVRSNLLGAMGRVHHRHLLSRYRNA
ncbi:ATP-binding protein [Thermodesulfobacteriota bacterium]